MVFVHYDPVIMKNITELPVRETQIHARSLIKAFTAAASSARWHFGVNVQKLPEPITVPCVQSDGQNFHFTVFQLNTLDLNGTEGDKNFCWSLPSMKLYEWSEYKDGIPTLEGYNPEVFKTLKAFYGSS